MVGTNSSGMRSGVKKTAVRVVFLLLSLCITLLLGGGADSNRPRHHRWGGRFGAFGVRFAADKEIRISWPSRAAGTYSVASGRTWMRERDSKKAQSPDGTKWVKMSRSFKDQKEFELFERCGGPMGDLGSSDIQITQKQTLFSVTTSYLAKLDLATAMQAIGEGAGVEVPVEMLSSIIPVREPSDSARINQEPQRRRGAGQHADLASQGHRRGGMTAESSSLRWGVVGGFIGGGVVVLAVIVALIVVLTRRRRQPVPIAAVARSRWLQR